MCTKYWLTCPGKKCDRLTDRPAMTIAVDWDVKNQTNNEYITTHELWHLIGIGRLINKDLPSLHIIVILGFPT